LRPFQRVSSGWSARSTRPSSLYRFSHEDQGPHDIHFGAMTIGPRGRSHGGASSALSALSETVPMRFRRDPTPQSQATGACSSSGTRTEATPLVRQRSSSELDVLHLTRGETSPPPRLRLLPTATWRLHVGLRRPRSPRHPVQTGDVATSGCLHLRTSPGDRASSKRSVPLFVSPPSAECPGQTTGSVPRPPSDRGHSSDPSPTLQRQLRSAECGGGLP
jgi:hypothetical protein